ncbi:MAG: alcohol dehydrogenase [Rhodoglobus sp.]|nr:alcohol dehydrogenase [Rhodoglobus sp.]
MSRAIVAPEYGEPDVLQFVEVGTPAPGEGEVTIAVRAAGVNPADLKRLRGEFGRNEASLPLRLGSEIAGVVTAVGADAVGPAGPVAVGDEVIGFRVSGGYSEEVTVAAASVLPKPAGLSFEQGAGLLAVGVTAEHLLQAAAVGAGDRVIVHGASGGVGSIAVQLALLQGAVVVGTAGKAHQEAVRALGATPVEYGPGLEARIRAIFPGGADAALDTIGTDEAVDTSVALVDDRRRIVTINAFRRAAELGFKSLGSGPGADPGSAVRMAARLPLIELAGRGKLAVHVARTFPLAQAAGALEFVASGHPGGKVILLP